MLTGRSFPSACLSVRVIFPSRRRASRGSKQNSVPSMRRMVISSASRCLSSSSKVSSCMLSSPLLLFLSIKILRASLGKFISAPPLVRCSNYTPLVHGATLKRCGQLALLAALIVEPTLKCVVHRYIALAYLLLCRWPNSTHQALQAAGQSFGFVLALEEAIDLLVLRTQLLNKHLFVTLKRTLVLHQIFNAILVLLEHELIHPPLSLDAVEYKLLLHSFITLRHAATGRVMSSGVGWLGW